ncbi:MAG: response regulator transcription factor [Firmicutes bacterium]|nr:response regulator transcription factor [Bacillota bacterium]
MIYVVEDDSGIRELMVYTLDSVGFDAVSFGCGADFFAALEPERAELVLLDLMLPGEDGLSILQKLRASPGTDGLPVIVVSAMGAETDKVAGLDSGADDYIAKPFGVRELLARVRAVLRRGRTPAAAAEAGREEDILSCGPVTLFSGRHVVTVNGIEAALTLKEYELLQYLMRHRGYVISRDKLLGAVWGYSDVETRTVDVHVRTLRQKLGEGCEIVNTVRGVGYKVDSDAQASF